MADQDATIVLTPVGTLSFPKLDGAELDTKGRNRYALALIFDEGFDPSQLQAAAKAAVIKKWQTKVPPGISSPVRKTGEVNSLAKSFGDDRYFINCATYNDPPSMVDQALRPIAEDAVRATLYPGARVRLHIQAYGYTTNGNGIAWGLQAIQKTGDGPRLDSRVRGEDVFTVTGDGSSPFDSPAPVEGNPSADSDFLS